MRPPQKTGEWDMREVEANNQVYASMRPPQKTGEWDLTGI